MSGFKAADIYLLNPEMFPEIEFEANEETSNMNNKESEGDNHSTTSVTTEVNTQNVVPSEPQPGSYRT